MSLTIDQLDVRCRAAPERRSLASDLEHWTRYSFASALEPHLGPSLDRLTGIHLIRRLEVRLRLTGREWTEGRFLEAACRAFTEALFRTLAYPSSADPSGRAHYRDATRWRAALIRWLLTGERDRAWHFEDVAPPQSGNPRHAALLLILEEPASLPSLLRVLHEDGTLTHVAAQWDDLEAERIFLAISRNQLAADVAPGAEIAWTLLRRALEIPPPQGRAFASRQHALLVFAAGEPGAAGVREIFHLLQAARWMLEDPSGMHPERTVFFRQAGGVHPAIGLWRRILEQEKRSAAWTNIAQALAQKLPASVSDSQVEAEWIRSDNAGVFLLGPLVLALDWYAKTAGLSARAVSSVLGGVFQTAIGRFDPHGPSFDPAVSLLAGLGAEPSLREVRAALAGVDLPALAREWQIDHSAFWTHAADRLLSELGSRLRGFRHAPPDAIARSFVRIAGRIQVSEGHLRVILDPTPYSVVLHLAGCDGAQPRFPWLDPLTVSVLLEGL